MMRDHSGEIWTEEGHDFLRANHSRMTTEELAEALGRSRNAVGIRLSILGLKARRYWTAEEEETLQRLYPTTTVGELAALLERSVPAVRQRAFKLGLRKADQRRSERKSADEMSAKPDSPG
jgi:hypothetical protein